MKNSVIITLVLCFFLSFATKAEESSFFIQKQIISLDFCKNKQFISLDFCKKQRFISLDNFIFVSLQPDI